jgi:HK97 family phage major capsid protein
VFREPVEKRVLTSDVSTATGGGGSLIATDLYGQNYIDRLRSALIIRGLGATVLDGLTGNVDIPKLTTSATGYWVAENSAITVSDLDFDSVPLRPKHVGALTEFSRNLLLQSSPDVETLIRGDLAAVLSRAIDSAAIQGGAANQPTDILATAAVDGTTDFETPSWTAVLELIEKVESADATGSAFATNASVVRVLRSTAKVGASDSVMVQQEPQSLAGFPLAQSSLVPSATIIFGRWSDLLLGIWSALDILPNPYATDSYSRGSHGSRNGDG